MENVKKELLDILGDKREIVTNITKVSRSGLSRRIKVFIMNNDELVSITYRVSKLLKTSANDDGLFVRGFGMDMEFSITRNISRALFDNDYYLSYMSI